MNNLPYVFERGGAEHRTYRMAGFCALFAVMLFLPFILPEFQVTRLNRAIATGVAILGLNLVVGYSGLLALCQSAFIALGAFTSASLIMDHGWDYWMTIPAGMLMAFLIGLLLGVPSLKIKGLYLAMATVAFAAAFPSLTKLEFFGIPERTGGANGREIVEKLNPPDWMPFVDVTEPGRYRYFPIALLGILTFWAVGNFVKSRPGRAVISIRDNEIGAAVSGVNLRRFKVLNFGLSAAIGGLAGVMWAMNSGFVAEQDFTFVLMVDLLVGLVVGGVATVSGAVIGALVVVFGRWLCQTYFDYSSSAVVLWGLLFVGTVMTVRKLDTATQRMVATVGAAIGAVLLLLPAIGAGFGALSGISDLSGGARLVVALVVVALAGFAIFGSRIESLGISEAGAITGALMAAAPIGVLIWDGIVKQTSVEDGGAGGGFVPGLYQLNGDGPLSQAIFGIVLIVVVFFAPQGIVGTWRQLWSRIVRILPVAPDLREDAEILVNDVDTLTAEIEASGQAH